MHCIVTAGPTYEPLDKVRRLTNFSTGTLGAELAAFLQEHRHKVTLLIGESATYRGDLKADVVSTFTTTKHLRDLLQSQATSSPAALFHAAAVSDFTFGKLWLRSEDGKLSEDMGGKISTRAGNLLAELRPSPKIIAEVRDWFPNSVLVGWKYEVDGGQPEVLAAAERQLVDSRTDACIANGPAYGEGFGLVKSHGVLTHFSRKKLLFQALELLIAGTKL